MHETEVTASEGERGRRTGDGVVYMGGERWARRWSMVLMMGALGCNEVNHSFRWTASTLPTAAGDQTSATLLSPIFPSASHKEGKNMRSIGKIIVTFRDRPYSSIDSEYTDA